MDRQRLVNQRAFPPRGSAFALRAAGQRKVMLLIALALALSLTLTACGDEEPTPADPASVSVCDAVQGEVPDTVPALRGSVVPLSVLGAAAHPGSLLGFVLTADGCSIFVAAADPASVARLDEGEMVTVRGGLSTLEEVEAERIRRVLRLPRDAKVISGTGIPSPAPIEVGAPFVDGFSLTGEPASG